MKRTFTPLGCVVFTIVLLVMGLMLVVVLASVRYDGPDGVALRIRAEIADRRPHPEFVPTPLPTSTGRPASVTAAPNPGTGEEIAATPTLTPAPQATEEEEISAPLLTATPTQLPTATPTPTSSPTPIHCDVTPSVRLSGFTHVWQKWNNCGPATLAMDLTYFDSALSQDDLAAALKGNQDDKNVSPEEMVQFARSQGFKALVRVNGDFEILRLFLSNGIPVMVETWLEDEPGNGMGHYRLLAGYSDAEQQWIVYDSYVSKGVRSDEPYQGILMPYGEMYDLWTVFNRTYILIYTEELEPLVLSILGQEANDAFMWQRALQQARQEVQENPDDPFAWFNLGTDLVALGQFGEATEAYGKARVIGLPWRMLWYQFGPFQAYYETGQYEELIALANATISTAGNIEETYYWKGLGLAALGNINEARLAWERALELNAAYSPAANALAGLDSPRPESQLLLPEAVGQVSIPAAFLAAMESRSTNLPQISEASMAEGELGI